MLSREIIDQLDPKIAELVIILNNELGFQTFTSCQAGIGHVFQYPTVGIDITNKPNDLDNLISFINNDGYLDNFQVKIYLETCHPVYSIGDKIVVDSQTTHHYLYMYLCPNNLEFNLKDQYTCSGELKFERIYSQCTENYPIMSL